MIAEAGLAALWLAAGLAALQFVLMVAGAAQPARCGARDARRSRSFRAR